MQEVSQLTIRPVREASILFVLLTGAATLLFVYPAMREALWTDEIYSLMAAEEPPLTIIKQAAAYKRGTYDHPPLYFILLHQLLLVGSAPLWLRLPSVLCASAAAFLLMNQYFRTCIDKRLGFGIALALLMNPTVHFQATSVRMYALELLLAVAAYMLVDAIRQSERKQTIQSALALMGVLILMLYTSYFALFFVLAIGLDALAGWLRPSLMGSSKREASLWMLAACAGAASALIPWMETFRHMMAAEQEATLPAETRVEQIRLALNSLLSGISGACVTVVGLISAVSLGPRRMCNAASIVIYVSVPLVFLGLFLPSTRFFSDRYLVPFVPILVAQVLLGWHALWDRLLKNRTGAGVILLLSIFPLIAVYGTRLASNWMTWRPDWWGAARILEMNATPSEFILTGGHLSGEELQYHLKTPDQFSFIHYAIRMEKFFPACSDPNVVWYVNNSPVPPNFQELLDRFFPYRAEFPGNRLQPPSSILVYAKKPFNLPWDGQVRYVPPIAPKP